ncbi:MAG TPA: hypothetical protein DEH24_00980 [Alteromonas sp.]|nr:hypothetical protein [Alteromonas sp.]|tara:strand:- start:1578 stop:2051 length:474 start_codon:yes stop_codon:yes gene_type:complete
MNIDITQVPPTSAVIEQHRVKLGVKERRKTLVLGFLFVTAPLAFAVSLVWFLNTSNSWLPLCYAGVALIVWASVFVELVKCLAVDPTQPFMDIQKHQCKDIADCLDDPVVKRYRDQVIAQSRQFIRGEAAAIMKYHAECEQKKAYAKLYDVTNSVTS